MKDQFKRKQMKMHFVLHILKKERNLRFKLS